MAGRYIEGSWKGEYFVSSAVIGMGSDGTTVFEGFYNGIPVAVKRLVQGHRTVSADDIPRLMVELHPNVVRYWGFKYEKDFQYLPLERCKCSLHDLIQALSAPSGSDFSHSPGDPPSILKYKDKLRDIRDTMQDVNLWTDGRPSTLLLKLMREVVLGLRHLHHLEIIHGDLKPQNVLITGKPLVAKLTDIGISKCLHAINPVTSGWQAPELLLPGGRETPAVDMFSLGCVLFFCVTGGKHPFGKHRERDIKIENNTMDLSLVASISEAHDLISRLLNPDPKLRPKASRVLNHPFFWSSEMRLSFLCHVSDRVELEAGAPDSPLLKALENTALLVFGVSWDHKIETKVKANLRSYGTYDGKSVKDLLRAVRNIFSHYMDAPKRVQVIVGPVPDGLDAYFAERFPTLLMESYRVLSQFCKKEESFREYFNKKNKKRRWES